MWPLAIPLALNVIGGYVRAQAARRAAEAQARQDEFNAHLQDMAAGDALQRGEVDSGNVKRQTSEAISSDKAQLGASGVDVQAGSALDALAGQRARGELAALVVSSNAKRQAWGFEGQAANYRAHGQYALQQGDDAFLAGLLGTGASTAEMAAKSGLVPGVTSPIIRVGEPTEPAPLSMTGYPLSGFPDATPSSLPEP
jgi:hypothetical protein